MFDDIFDQQPPRRKPAPPLPVSDSEMVDDLGSFGWLRSGRERAIMLEVRHKNGQITAHSYGWLESAEFNPSEGISLNFSGKTVKLIGRNLNVECRPDVRLFEGLLRHRVPWIQEADEPTLAESLESCVVIEEVTVD